MTKSSSFAGAVLSGDQHAPVGLSSHIDDGGVSSHIGDSGVSVRLSRLPELLLVALWEEADEWREDSLLHCW